MMCAESAWKCYTCIGEEVDDVVALVIFVGTFMSTNI